MSKRAVGRTRAEGWERYRCSSECQLNRGLIPSHSTIAGPIKFQHYQHQSGPFTISTNLSVNRHEKARSHPSLTRHNSMTAQMSRHRNPDTAPLALRLDFASHRQANRRHSSRPRSTVAPSLYPSGGRQPLSQEPLPDFGQSRQPRESHSKLCAFATSAQQTSRRTWGALDRRPSPHAKGLSFRALAKGDGNDGTAYCTRDHS